MKKSLKKNVVLNTVRTIFRIFIPLITIPYITHILSVDSIGKYNFAASIISYFVLLSQLGINTYAIREGAKYRDSKTDFSRFVSEIFTINIISTILSYFLLFLIIFLVPGLHTYKLLLIILSVEIILYTLGCEWVYAINEEYAYITIRSILFQIIYIALLFLLVNNEKDLLLYCFVMLISTAGPNIPNIFGLRKRCDIKIVFDRKILKHLIPILLLFANSIATTIYVSSDTTILGLICGDYYVGIYSISSKIYSTIKNVLSALIIVSIPRLSYLYGSRKINEFSKLATKIINSLILFVLPTVVGLICVSKNVILLLAGNGFIEGVLSLQILATACIFSIFSWFYTSCILIPGKKDKDVLVATIIAGLLNVLLNFLLIPKFKHNAAAFTTLLAEFISFFICYFKSKKIVKIKIPINNIFKTILGCISIIICCYYLDKYLYVSLYIKLTIKIVLSIISYTLIEIFLKNDSLKYFIDLLPSKIIKLKKLVKVK